MPNALNMPEVLAELIMTNHRLRGEQGPAGFRRYAVEATARDGRSIRFAEVKKIQPTLENCINGFNQQLDAARTPLEVSHACAVFWMYFIAIHPFTDGNGRTARVYLRREIERRHYTISGFGPLDRYVMEGDVRRDIPLLTTIFQTLVSPASSPMSKIS